MKYVTCIFWFWNRNWEKMAEWIFYRVLHNETQR